MGIAQHAQTSTQRPPTGRRAMPIPKPAPAQPELSLKIGDKVDKPSLWSWLTGWSLTDPAKKPDRTYKGFIAAIRSAITFAEGYGYNSADLMCEEIEALMRDALRVPSGIVVTWSATNKATSYPRFLIVTEWGLREAVDGQISFDLIRMNPARARP